MDKKIKHRERRERNYVAKYARKFNKPAVHRDRTKYIRTNNWKNEFKY